MTGGEASTPQRFFRAANEFGFTFNWAYASRRATAYFSSGLLPAPGPAPRPPAADARHRRATSGAATCREGEHPHDVGGPGGLLLNWNNHSAPGFMHGDDEPYGSVQRVEMFDKFPRRVKLADDVSIMNRAATEDVRSPVWPAVSGVLHGGPAPNARDAQVVRPARRLGPPRRAAARRQQRRPLRRGRADGHGRRSWRPIAEAVMRAGVRATCSAPSTASAAWAASSGESYVDKDLRTRARAPESRASSTCATAATGRCGACRASLWSAVDAAVTAASRASRGPTPPPGAGRRRGSGSRPA